MKGGMVMTANASSLRVGSNKGHCFHLSMWGETTLSTLYFQGLYLHGIVISEWFHRAQVFTNLGSIGCKALIAVHVQVSTLANSKNTKSVGYVVCMSLWRSETRMRARRYSGLKMLPSSRISVGWFDPRLIQSFFGIFPTVPMAMYNQYHAWKLEVQESQLLFLSLILLNFFWNGWL